MYKEKKRQLRKRENWSDRGAGGGRQAKAHITFYDHLTCLSIQSAFLFISLGSLIIFTDIYVFMYRSNQCQPRSKYKQH